ncbi:DUF397 domain-containing protein [Streptomyces botrytidirepellens]|uniref:DUF397 domain-containing protein n=1 Tax=Streptomyces botrytidirepellens TaxID=2486417 RepID=A0A3M8SGA2_9ACTN|nr:DUF397 domain-containing protein [Streptomyces botrytidirepellens]RNF80179.1 DUF397 domain-containing protein [Streptomyces botrytidirepellens]
MSDHVWQKSSYSHEGANCLYVAKVPAAWHKSSYSQEGSACLNVAAAASHTIALRESDEPDVILTTSPASLGTFIRAAKAGTFDGLAQDR